MTQEIRNIAIIAHVDHGKTTLVDQLLRQSGIFRDNQKIAERVMDSMDLEREKGITIKAKNTSILWKDSIINIVDTPGHADFGAEVERVLKMVDGVLLLVDAFEGPQAQTRFVLRKALQNGLFPIVVVNKLDREFAEPLKVHDKVLELFLELEANEEQFNAPFLYVSAKDGYALRELDDERVNMNPLFEAVLEHIPAPRIDDTENFRMLVSNIEWDDFVGRVAVGRIQSGEVKAGDWIYSLRRDGIRERCKVTKVFAYHGLATQNKAFGTAGNIVGVSGFTDIDIGETLAADETMEALPFVEIDPPTITMEFAVNNGPLAGQDGKLVTSRQIRERLLREMKTNISIKVGEKTEGTRFDVAARGAMQIAILVEQMRREGYEVLVSRPSVIQKEINGKIHEPFETLWVEVPEEDLNSTMKRLSQCRAHIENMEHQSHGIFIEATIPTRGLIGLEFDLVNITSGRGVMSHMFKDYLPHCGDIPTRQTGTLVSMDTGKATGYALFALQERGKLFVAAGDDVYQGMVIGENPRSHDLPVNPTKAKQLTNFRAAGKDDNTLLAPPIRFSLERSIEYIAADEYVEATPKVLRIRKKVLCPHERKRQSKMVAAAG